MKKNVPGKYTQKYVRSRSRKLTGIKNPLFRTCTGVQPIIFLTTNDNPSAFLTSAVLLITNVFHFLFKTIVIVLYMRFVYEVFTFNKDQCNPTGVPCKMPITTYLLN